MIIAVASGKGGTGKTTVAVNLALSTENATLVDCDVEEPNVHLFFHPESVDSVTIGLPIPVVKLEKCTLCGACAEFCQFNAIFVGPQSVVVYPELCHSCGGCVLVCPENAITERNKTIGRICETTIENTRLIYGELNIGEPIATSLIRAVKQRIRDNGFYIIDAPPGTACPVIEAIRGTDYVILVTEPTPFGLHDLSMAVDVVRELEIPFGVIINKAGVGNKKVEQYCRENNIPILMEIPFTREIAELYSRGVPFVKIMSEWRDKFSGLVSRIRRLVTANDV